MDMFDSLVPVGNAKDSLSLDMFHEGIKRIIYTYLRSSHVVKLPSTGLDCNL